MSARQAFIITLTVILTLVLAYLIWWLSEIVLLLVGAIIFASAVRPYVAALSRRGVNRAVAILLIYALVFISTITVIIVAVPPLIMFLVSFIQSGDLSDRLAQLATRLAIFGWDQFRVLIPVVQLPEQFNQLLVETTNEVQQQAWTITQSTMVGLGQTVLLFTLAFYWLTSREQALSLLMLLSPKVHRLQVYTLWNAVEERLGNYVRGQIILMVVIGVASYVSLLLLGVPYAAALALIAGLTEAIPYVGPLMGAVPAVLVGFTVSPVVGLAVMGVYLVIQALEGNVLVPRIMSSSVGLNPLVVIVAIVAGGTINGIVGAILAIPLAGALQVIAQHLWVTPALAALPSDVVGPGGEEPEPTDEDAPEGLPEPEMILEELVVMPQPVQEGAAG
jgi:predicted PurR-regulated permease PerM